jgi:hypothetical protein
MRHTDDNLTGNDDLPRLYQSLDYHTVRISQQDSVARLVASNVGLGSGRLEIRSCRLGGSFGLVIVRCRNRAGEEKKIAVSHLVLRGLVRARPYGGNGFLVRAHGEPQVRGIDTHERLAALDGLPGINQAFQDLPRNSEPQVALHASRDDAGEGTL